MEKLTGALNMVHAEPKPWSRNRQALVLGLVLGVTALSLSPLWNAQLVGDAVFQAQPMNWTWKQFQSLWTQSYWMSATGFHEGYGMYRPLGSLLLRLVVSCCHESPAWIHTVPVAWHLLNMLLLYALLGAWQVKEIRRLGVTALFGLHPGNSEAIASVVGLQDMMALTLLMGALMLLTRMIQDGFRASRVALLMLIVFAAPWIKESAIVLAGTPVLMLWLPRPHPTKPLPWRGMLGLTGLTFVAATLYLLLRSELYPLDLERPVNEILVLLNPLLAEDSRGRVLGSILVLGTYMRLLVFPWRLTLFYGHGSIPIPDSFWDWRVGLVVMLLMAAAGMAWWRKRRGDPLPWLSLGIMGLVYLPFSHWFLELAGLLGERYLILLTPWFALFLSGFIIMLPRRPIAGTVFVLIALLGAFRLHDQIRTWLREPEFTNFHEAAAPRSAHARMLAVDGFFAMDALVPALDQVDAALALYPAFCEAHVKKALILNRLGRPLDAKETLLPRLRCPAGHGSVGAALLFLSLKRGCLPSGMPVPDSWPEAVVQAACQCLEPVTLNLAFQPDPLIQHHPITEFLLLYLFPPPPPHGLDQALIDTLPRLDPTERASYRHEISFLKDRSLRQPLPRDAHEFLLHQTSDPLPMAYP